MEDSVFGQIDWRSDAWHGDINVPFFSNYGKNVVDTTDKGDGSHARVASAEMRLPVEIDTNDVPKRPSQSQRDAFAEIKNRRNTVWRDVIESLGVEYHKQWPKRLRYWKLLYGDKGINKSLPTVKEPDDFKPLSLPVSLHVSSAAGDKVPIDINLLLALTWFSEGSFVTIREGEVVAVNGLPSWHTRKWQQLNHEVFGELRRPSERAPTWLGTTEVGPFAEWAAISVNRATWDENASERTPDSNLDWPIARGDCFIRVYVSGSKSPSKAQIAEYQAFKKNQNSDGTAIKSALLSFYQENLKQNRSSCKGSNAKRIVPEIENAEALKDMTELRLLNVFPGNSNERPAIGMVFRGAWTGQEGVGVRWRNGQIEEVGKAGVATPPSK